ncbi:MAG: NfeD family protein, partial [Deltaproteobacteria bacterium]|nr:NfeD family protein [Deltaproteobacteria bacterium]
ILVALEIVVPGVFLLWIGIGALATGCIVGATGIISWEIQCLIFVPLAFLSLFMGRKFILKAAPSEDTTLNRRLTTYIGRRAEVVQAIVNGKGRIRLGDTLWIVQGPDCPVGSQVTVTGVDGSELIVTREDEPARP